MPDRLKLEEGWSTLFLVWALVMTAAMAIVAAELMSGLEVLLVIGSVAVLAGLALAKSSFPSRTAHIFALVYGFALVSFMIGATLPAELTWRERVLDLIFRQVQWLNKAIGGGTSRDGLIFILQTSGIFWLLGYTAAWYTFRKPRVWAVVLPTGVVLLSVVYYYYGTKPLALYLVVYALLALLYIARTHLVAREKEWRRASVRYERLEMQIGFLRAGFLVAIFAVLVAWTAPALGASASVGDALYGANKPWSRFQDTWTRLFASLRSYGSGANDPYQDSLVLGGPRTVGNDPVMDIFVSEQLPYIYWHAVALDTYDGQGGWSVANQDTVLHMPDDGVLNTPFVNARRVITQTVVTYMNNSSTVYGAPSLIGANQQVFVDFNRDEQGAMEVQGLRARYVLRAGDNYNVVSQVSTANAADLRAASTDYPAWVSEVYLQMPEGITEETRQLAAELTDPHDNVYDKAWAVQTWLRENITYNDQIDAPPDDVEPVHYTLFTSREAYCTYYASAMAMMLRSVGIPARIVNGYAQGEFRPDSNSYRVKASDAHTWVEVYFPQYGWIQFEPTASIPVVVRPENAAAAAAGPLSTSALPPGRDELLPDDDLGLGETPNLPEAPPEEQVGAGLLSTDTLGWVIRGTIGVALLAIAGLTMLFANRYNQKIERNVEKSYGRLESWARWLGISFRPVHTPYERADMLAMAIPDGRSPIRNLTRQYVLRMFSPRRNGDEAFDPRMEWRVLRPMLLRESIRMRLRRLRRKPAVAGRQRVGGSG